MQIFPVVFFGSLSYLNSNFKKIYEDTVTTTTNEYGFFGWIANTDIIILSVRASDRILVPFIHGNAWYVVELNRTASGGLVGNKTFDVTMTFILKCESIRYNVYILA